MPYSFDQVIPRENTHSVQYDLRKYIFGTEDVIPMWVADMDFPTPPFIIDAIKSRLDHPILGYTFRGEGYFQSFMSWAQKRYHWKIKKNWMAFSPGIVPALNMIIMEFTRPGDSVVVQPPVYFPFFSAIKNHGRNMAENPLMLKNGRYNMDYGQLESLFKKGARLMLICHPHNPGGMEWTKEELKILAELCIKYGVLLISDEVHADLVLPGKVHVPIASLSEEIAQQTITCMAPSKTFNTAGLSTSFIITSNPEFKKRFDRVMDQVHVGNGNIFGHIASEAAYTHGEEWLNQLLHYLKNNMDFAIQFIEKHIPGIIPMRPEATYLLWLDCKNLGMKNEELKKFMIEKARVGMNDGSMFGTGGDRFQRMNVGCPISKLEKALLRIKKAVTSG